MKKLFALISLLGLVLGLGGTLNAQETLDRVELQGRFAKQGAEQTLKFKFSATPGEKFIIRWHLGHFDTIDVKTSEELEATYTFSKEYTDQHASFSFDFLALSFTGHIRNFHIDSNNRYTGLIFLDCPLLDTAHISHNDLENLDFRNCPALTFVDCSYNKLIYSFFRQDSNWFPNLTYLDYSHNDIKSLIATDCITLKTLDISYNRRLDYLIISDCKALVNLTAIHNDSIRDYAFLLPQYSSFQSLTLGYNHQLGTLNLSQCPNLTTLNCYGNSQLTSLYLSNNPKLETLNCYDNEKLTHLYINHTSFDSLDLSSMPTLKFLSCDYNQLSYIDLSPCKNLQEFYCRNNRFSSLKIPDDMVLHQLDCDSNHIPLSTLVDLEQHTINKSDTSRQFLTTTPLQVGRLLDLRSETHLSDCRGCEQYTLFFNGQQIEERSNDGLEDLDYGLLTFDKAGNYHLHLQSTLLYECEECEEGYFYVSTMSAYYDLTVVDSVVRPQFSIPSGAVLPDTELILSTPTPDARIYYTTDGSEPNETALEYTVPIRITEAITVKAIAIQDTFKSHVATASYTIDTVARPTFSIPSGSVVRPDTSLILSTTTSGASIYYTTDGSEPDETALAYTAPIRITEAMTVKAVAIYKTVKSQITAASYAMDTVARPTFSIPSGKVKRGTTVSLNTTTPNARIIYTTDGIEPDNNALEYTDPIRITEAMTIKAVAIYKTLKSQVSSASYTIDSVANEHDLKASNLRVYAKDRTIYLSEMVGEVEVFTMDGHCVYRGYDTAIPVKRSGIYVVSAVGRRWKVAVR